VSGALAGLRVVDCSRLIAGGMLATILADHGADVIKVENPRGGDPLRTWLRIDDTELENLSREGIV
jgi:crotonobetainyl-CoA:carnitine CoA-transferase CaiB-like acyl-CoA transferase